MLFSVLFALGLCLVTVHSMPTGKCYTYIRQKNNNISYDFNVLFVCLLQKVLEALYSDNVSKMQRNLWTRRTSTPEKSESINDCI